MANDLVLFHKNCFDGFGAAWVARQYLDDDTRFIEMSYGEEVPSVDGVDTLYVLDFSFPREVMESLYSKVGNMVVLDHHKTALANCQGLPFCTFDMNRSGAGLTWDYFHPVERRPRLIDYIEDRDLWRFNLVNSREVHAWLSSFPKDFSQWDELHRALESRFSDMVDQGRAILRYHDQKVEEMCRETQLKCLPRMESAVPTVNCPYSFGSDVGARLLELNPHAEYAAYYFTRADGEQQWGLRSEDSRVDVSEVAKQHGGGGHRNAAGFVWGKVTR